MYEVANYCNDYREVVSVLQLRLYSDQIRSVLSLSNKSLLIILQSTLPKCTLSQSQVYRYKISLFNCTPSLNAHFFKLSLWSKGGTLRELTVNREVLL